MNRRGFLHRLTGLLGLRPPHSAEPEGLIPTRLVSDPIQIKDLPLKESPWGSVISKTSFPEVLSPMLYCPLTGKVVHLASHEDPVPPSGDQP